MSREFKGVVSTVSLEQGEDHAHVTVRVPLAAVEDMYLDDEVTLLVHEHQPGR